MGGKRENIMRIECLNLKKSEKLRIYLWHFLIRKKRHPDTEGSDQLRKSTSNPDGLSFSNKLEDQT